MSATQTQRRNQMTNEKKLYIYDTEMMKLEAISIGKTWAICEGKAEQQYFCCEMRTYGATYNSDLKSQGIHQNPNAKII
jgi:hypothetical protein